MTDDETPIGTAEAARLLGCSVRNVTKHRLKGLDKLRLLLKQNG